MSSPCLSGGGRTYGFDLEIVKSPSTSSRTSQTSSPSSTVSESGNSPIAISTRKPRTPRKRPNQTYNEAAALLSTAYPKIFSVKHLANPRRYAAPEGFFPDESSELLLHFRAIDSSGFLLDQPAQEKPSFRIEPKLARYCENPCQSSGETESQTNPAEVCDELPDFDAESMLDEEIEEGIDSIMGNLSVEADTAERPNSHFTGQIDSSFYGTNPIGMGFGGKFHFGFPMRALRRVDEGNWWSFPTVDVHKISPKLGNSNSPETAIPGAPAKPRKDAVSAEKKKKKKKFEKPAAEPKSESAENEAAPPRPSSGLLLKLNYDEVLNVWSDRPSPLSDEVLGTDSPGNDVYARLAQIDLVSEVGGVREASVQRYKEKRRTRLFAKKIRYQVRKVNADRRPRMKGRFVRRQSSSGSSQDERVEG